MKNLCVVENMLLLTFAWSEGEDRAYGLMIRKAEVHLRYPLWPGLVTHLRLYLSANDSLSFLLLSMVKLWEILFIQLFIHQVSSISEN